MQAAVFESEPQASAAATTIRELGFNADVVVFYASSGATTVRSSTLR
jgi:hypothetical protein